MKSFCLTLSEVEQQNSLLHRRFYRNFSLSDDGTFLWLMNFAFYAFQIDFHGVERKQNETKSVVIYSRGRSEPGRKCFEVRGDKNVDKAKG